MKKSYISLKFEQFKNKFNSHFLNRKKVRALENFAKVVNFSGAKYIRLLKELIEDGFLDEKEESFLDYQIEKAEIDAYFWAHRTPSLKLEMERRSKQQVAVEDLQLKFAFERAERAISAKVPVHLLKYAKTNKVKSWNS